MKWTMCSFPCSPMTWKWLKSSTQVWMQQFYSWPSTNWKIGVTRTTCTSTHPRTTTHPRSLETKRPHQALYWWHKYRQVGQADTKPSRDICVLQIGRSASIFRHTHGTRYLVWRCHTSGILCQTLIQPFSVDKKRQKPESCTSGTGETASKTTTTTTTTKHSKSATIEPSAQTKATERVPKVQVPKVSAGEPPNREELVERLHKALRRKSTSIVQLSQCKSVDVSVLTISLYYQNAGGLCTKQKRFFRNAASFEYDLIIITETWLRQGINDAEYFDD